MAADTPYPITTFQPVLFAADSLGDAATKIRRFCAESVTRPFYARFDGERIVVVDRAVVPVVSSPSSPSLSYE